jgi:multidrug efflux system membrane fusion protein
MMLDSPTAFVEQPDRPSDPGVPAPPPSPAAPPTNSPATSATSRRAYWGWLLVAALVLTGAGFWIRRRDNTATPPGSPASATTSGGVARGPVIPVVAAVARAGDIDVYDTGLGTVTPLLTVTVKSRVDGQLLSVHYQEGQVVRKGDLLVEIDPRPYQVQLTLAEGQMAKDRAALANARLDLTRDQELFAKMMVPEQQLATQQSLVAQDEGAVKADQGQIDSANLNISYCHITALISGRVGLRLVDPGNMVHAADTNGLLVIAQMQPISAIFTISEDQLPVVLKKMRAGPPLAVDAYDRNMTTRLAQGTLTSLDNQIDPTTGTLRLRASFGNEDGTLFPNQFVNARLLVEHKHGVTLVPTAAVQRNAQATYVFVVKPDHTVASRPVTVGTTEGDDSEIASGVTAGDTVVMTGVDKLQEGSKVDPQVAPANGRASAAPGSPKAR